MVGVFRAMLSISSRRGWDLLSAGTPGHAKHVAAFAELLAIYIAEKYTIIAAQRPDWPAL